MAEHPAAGPRRSHQTTLLVVAVTAAGFNLRTAIANLPPLFPDLQTQLHLSSAALSLLAATPVICFGAVAAFAAWLNRRFGEEVVLLVALGVLTAGLLLRGAAPGIMLFPGTILAASAIAILNVLLSSMIKRRSPERAGVLIGTYLTALCVGAIIASLLSVPLYQSSGGSARSPTSPARIKVRRYALAWQVMAFMGLQSLLYYAALSWLPTIFQDRGTSAVAAGNLLALMAAGNLVGALTVPVLAHRAPDQRALVVPSMTAMGVGLAGSLWAPLGGVWFWVLVLGIGQGSCLALAIFFMVARAPDPGVSASLSAFAQSAGYLVASAGPLEFGLLHSATGSWNIPAAVLLVLCGCGLVVGMFAARPLVLTLPGNQPSPTRVSETGPASRAI
jgi:CP family cyanate transporter-like MFS transporter